MFNCLAPANSRNTTQYSVGSTEGYDGAMNSVMLDAHCLEVAVPKDYNFLDGPESCSVMVCKFGSEAARPKEKCF